MTHADALSRRLARNRLTRRDALWLFGASVGVTTLQGCATSPVTGRQILVGMSPEQEREVDRQQSPHQFSQDLGAVQDEGVNRYVDEVADRLQPHVQRRDMPYSTRVLGANYVNAYTFPAGAMGVTRGIMTELQDESELAALLGHEMGHVNARHAAQRQGQAMLAQVAVVTVAVVAAAGDSRWAPAVAIGGMVGASALLASYSRDNEREADALGQEYLVRAGYPASGMTRLHQLLVSEQKSRPGLLETMFSSHPMSDERLQTARRLADSTYAASASAPAGRERFMDRTASLRRIKPTIDACQNGELAMSRKALPDAQGQFEAALRSTPRARSTRRRRRPPSWALRSSSACATPAAPTRTCRPTTACCPATPARASSRAWHWKAWATSRRRRANMPASCRAARKARPPPMRRGGSRPGAT